MNKEILRLAIPNIISNISVPMLSIVDTYLMGQLGNPLYLGAIAIGGTLFNFLFWGLSFLRMGTTGMTAQAYGKKDESEISGILFNAFLIAGIASLFILIFQLPIKNIGLKLMGGSEQVLELSSAYYNIRIWGTPAALGIMILNGWFLGMQNARWPLLITVFINIGNILFNVLFIYGFEMKSEGVAMGTIIAQYLGLLLAIGLFVFSYKMYAKELVSGWKFKADQFINFVNVNKDILIRTLCLIFVFSFFTAVSSRMGDVQLAANQILLQFLFIISYAIDGFAYAGESIVGKYTGAKNSKGLKRSVKYIFVWGYAFAIIFAVFFIFGGEWMLQKFTTNAEIVDFSVEYLPWLILIPFTGTAAYLWDGIFIGATAVKPMRNTMIIASFVIFLPVYLLLFPYLGNHALWLAMNLYMLSRGLLLTILSPQIFVKT